MDHESQDEEEAPRSQAGLDPKLVRSYLSFAKRAIKAHKAMLLSILFVGALLTGLVAKFIPRTYVCSTVMMTVENAILDGNRGPKPLAGANGMIMRHENLERLVKETGLIKKYSERRPPLLRFKDRL